jgi:hypothetical protein
MKGVKDYFLAGLCLGLAGVIYISRGLGGFKNDTSNDNRTQIPTLKGSD